MDAIPRQRDCGNSLLDRVPREEYARLEPHLDLVDLRPKQVLHQFEAEVGHVHFPTTALGSLLTVLEEDDPVEAGTVGREGMLGLSAALGVAESPHRVICQMGGGSLKVAIGPLLEAMARGPGLSELVRRYVAVTLRESGQGIACNALHPVEARACRWLLLVHDQAGADEFPLTQEFLAFMLGVRRQTVTVVARGLQDAGLIRYRRGSIEVRDRAAMEESSCECYASSRRYYRRVMGGG